MYCQRSMLVRDLKNTIADDIGIGYWPMHKIIWSCVLEEKIWYGILLRRAICMHKLNCKQGLHKLEMFIKIKDLSLQYVD